MNAPQKPGLLTTELWSFVVSLVASLTACLQAQDPGVQIAGVAALATVCCVLGGIYIWSRTQIKTRDRGGDF